ncbi:MAG: WD40/YVTN/BNR-like repeat-containing protein [Halobacteriota archaeon]
MTRLFVAFEDRLLRVDERDDGSWSAETVLAGPTLEAVAAHPAAPTRVFCGTFATGLQRSADGGDTWARVGEEIGPDTITAVAVDPSEPAIVYAGTEPSRVYRSSDGGESWVHRDGLTDLRSSPQWSFPPRPHTHHVRWIEVAPHDPGRLHVSIEAGALVRSFDAGETWTDTVPSARWDVHSLATHPDAPAHLWAAAGDGYAESTDGGDTWSHPEDGLSKGYCWSVAVDPGDPDTVLLSAAAGPRTAHRSARADSAVFRKRGGDTWTQLAGDLPTGAGVLRYDLTPGRVAGELFAASNVGLFRTLDAGDSWDRLDVALPAALESQTVNGMVLLG